ncbi:MAG: hypothetical protein IJN17_03460 [Clostridia bacterium]|nr:hypothetical protein [Clostridia bacterium]
MKKLLSFLLVLILSFALVACGGGKEEPKETVTGDGTGAVEETTPEDENKGPIIPINVDDYYKAVLFDLPAEPFRDVIVDYMRKQSSIEWVCGADFGVYETFNSWGINLTFKRGEKYTGIPYADTKVSYIQFEEALVNGRYTSESTAWKDVFGVQCISSVMNAIQQFDPDTCGYSSDLTPGLKDFKGVIVGEYTIPEGVQQTKQIIDANTPETMNESYAKLKKGDMVIRQDLINDNSHLRVVVEEPVIVRNAAGKINMTRSYIKCIEQTNSFDASRTDGVKTTWYVDHIYTFDALRTTDYVPLSLAIYDKPVYECEIPYITLDNEVTEVQIQKGVLGSVVKSNFPIRYVHLDVYTKDGQFVKRSKAYDMAKSYSVSLRKYGTTLTEGLENGEYTLVVTAGISRGSSELGRFDFSINK